MFLFSLVIAILTSSVEGTMECFRIENDENHEVNDEIIHIIGNNSAFPFGLTIFITPQIIIAIDKIKFIIFVIEPDFLYELRPLTILSI